PLAASAAWVYTTVSHTPENNKYRVIFQLKETITDNALYRGVVTILIRSLGGDTACKDACRYWAGNDKAETPLWQPKAFLSQSIIEDGYNEAAAAKMRPDSSGVNIDCDENTLDTAAYVLDNVLAPTVEGDYNRFMRITAACAAGGDRLFPAWSDWASRGHHGSGSNSRRVGNEKFFRGFNGSSVGTLFYLASEDDSGWRKNLPEELKEDYSSRSLGIPGVAGYDHEDFLGDPNEPSLIYEPIEYTQSCFSPDKPWTVIAAVDSSESVVESDEDIDAAMETEFIDADPDIEDVIPVKRRRSEDDEDKIEVIKERLQRLYPGLRQNEMTQELVYGDNAQPVHDISTAYIRISRGTSKVFNKVQTYDTAQVLGYENRFNPVTEYLDRVANTVEPCQYFDHLATELLGTSTEDIQNPTMPGGGRLADLILKRFLIGAVARIRTPGCVHDWMPVLVGGQNSGKSTFFQYLTPPDANNPGSYPWVSTVQQGIEYIKDRPHALHAGWIVVLDEAERYFGRRHIEALKNLLSVSVDRSARKYENEKSFPRSFVMAGATNNADFLTDPTGNRRFMPIICQGVVPSKQDPALKIIDLDRLKRDRDSIWSAACKAYLDDPVHTFSSWEISKVSDYVSSFARENAVEGILIRMLDQGRRSGYHPCNLSSAGQRGYVTLEDCQDWLNIDVTQRNRMQRDITDVLKSLGYQSRKITPAGGIQRRVWMCPLLSK
ncbi:MAG: VapE domain-containing protein, partial [Cyanobacteriota bacterium]|nr:VapE domain-containing protein [Cyanobacteriota bacterium]